MLAVIVVVAAILTMSLVATSVQLWRAYRIIHELEHILADADDRVRSLELKLLHSRRIT